jgi:hypothetical protein
MPFDKQKNQRKAFCFITFDSEQVVNELLKTPKQTISGKEVDVKKATPKPENMMMPMGRGGGRGGRGMRGGRGGNIANLFTSVNLRKCFLFVRISISFILPLFNYLLFYRLSDLGEGTGPFLSRFASIKIISLFPFVHNYVLFVSHSNKQGVVRQ